jgi:hypothetical protein
MAERAIKGERGVTWRKAGLAAASVAINAAFVAALSIATLGVRDRAPVAQPPLIYLEIEPRPLLRDEQPRPPTLTARTTPAAPTASRLEPRASTATPRAASPLPSPVRPRVAAPAPQGVQTPDDPWRVDPNDRRAAMARSLRQGLPGCASPELLNEMERRHCRDDFARRAENAAPITGSGDPRRDARFAREGARRLAQWEAQRRPLSGGVGVVGPADCVGSNFGTGCAGSHLDPSFAPDSSRNVRTRRDGPPASGVPMTPGSSGPGREP